MEGRTINNKSLKKPLTLREIQLQELDMLIEIDRICRKENLRYSLVCGTLLGAVRHHGFIPWDDDADVGIPRPDYEKFLKIFNANCSCDDYQLITENSTESDSLTFTKMINRNIVVDSGIINTEYLKIDIFPIDGLPSDKKKRSGQLKYAQLLKRIIVHADNDRSSEERFRVLGKIVAKLFHIFAKCYGSTRAKRNLIRLSKKYAFDDATVCGTVCWATYGDKECYPRSGFKNMIEMDFEGHSFLIINCWRLYLKKVFGNYMQLPPVEKRKHHVLKAYLSS